MVIFTGWFTIGPTATRLVYFVVIISIACHTGTCLWLFIASIQNKKNFDGTWMQKFHEDDNYGKRNIDLYIISFYWTIQTITQVGYGDVSGTNTTEMIFCSVVMIIGVITFSFANGTLVSIISNYDRVDPNYAEKLNILNKAHNDYHLPLNLIERLKKAVQYDLKKDANDLNNFIQCLPHKMKIEVSLYVYERIYKDIKFFHNRNQTSFISWMCPLLKPQYFESN